MAIKISGTTVIDDSRNLVNINSGLGVGINSNYSSVGTGITILNFVGSGTTITVTGGRADISAAGGAAGGGSLGISSNSFSSFVGSGVTHLNFVGAAVTAVGIKTAVVTITKSLTVGRRDVAAALLNLTTTSGNITLRSGSTVAVPL
jgi:hypothetical protein